MQVDETAVVPSDADSPSDSLFLIGIGASAGGLEAIRDLVRHLPESSNACYVIVQHLSPDHQSLLTTLIARESNLTVLDVTDGIAPEPNTIYVTPPNSDVIVRDNRLVLERPNPHGSTPKPSVDRFFRSAAETFRERAVGIVFSGTGSDGSYGLQAIQSAGGITIAQDDKSAKYDGMPMSAIETGCVDLVLSPEEIARHLNTILMTPRDLKQFKDIDANDSPLSDLLNILLIETHVDFRDYKQTTIRRRIERRMAAVSIASLREYTDFCRLSPDEVTALFKDLLISVTRFFRDPSEFESIKPYIEEMTLSATNQGLRLWVVGCATGEEVYSIAMLFADAMGGASALSKNRLQIFATDIDDAALEIARAGVYPRAAVSDIPQQYFGTYVHLKNDQVCIEQRLKDLILFSKHNICQDPPFLKINMACCRNVLIYFGTRLRDRVLSRLNYSLLPDGHLFLGKSETISVTDGLFEPVERNTHLYSKQAGTEVTQKAPPKSSGMGMLSPAKAKAATAKVETTRDQYLTMFETLASQIGADSLLLTEDLKIVRVFGDVSAFSVLTHQSRLKFDVTILRPELATEARSIASIALKNNVRKLGITRSLGKDPTRLTQLECFPMKAPGLDESYALLVFNTWSQPVEPKLAARNGLSVEAVSQIEALEHEISHLTDEHRQTIEELETTNEELQTTIEEFQSTNEELQSTNEEIETSNEELQSTNEELITVNEELQISTYEMNVLNDEQSAVLESVVSPLLIVDVSLHISKANSAAVELLGLRRPIDRPHLSQCRLPDGFPVLSEICNEAIKLGQPLTRNINSTVEIYSLDVAPFFNNEGQLRGATLLFHKTPVAPVSDA